MNIGDVYSDSGVKLYALKLTGNAPDADELISRCVEICCERLSKIQKIQSDGKFRNYFFVMMKFQFLKSIRDKKEFQEIEEHQLFTDPRIEDIDFAARSKKVNDTLKRMHFYSSGLLELYKTDSYRGISKKTNIHFVSVHDGIKQAKKEFKKIYNPMKIIIALPSLSGVEYHRLIVPMVNFAKKYGSKINVVYVNSENNIKDKWIQKLPEDTTHVIFSRNISPNIFQPEKAFAKIKERTNGKCKIVCDVDDYWYLPKNHILWNYYNDRNMSKCIITNIEMSDVVWCTTKVLKAEIKKINPNVHIVRNCIDTNEQMWNDEDVNDAFDKFLYAGGTTHKYDMALMKNQLNDIDFTIKGTNDDLKKWQKKYFPKAKILPFSDLTEYGEIYKDYGIVLAPLVNNKFNNLKSELKVIEAGNFGRCMLVSDCDPYKDHIKHLKTGIRVKKGEWGKWVNWIKGNHSAQKEMGDALKDYVNKNFRLNEENRTRFDTL